MPGCAALFEGEVDRPLPIGSVAITNQRAGSSALPAPIRKSRRWCVPESEAQIRIAFERSALQRAVGDVRLAVVDDRLARFERQVAERELAMRRIDVVGGERRMLHRRLAQAANSMTVRMPSPRARPAKPSLISSSADAPRDQRVELELAARATARTATGSRAAAARRRSSSGRCASRPSASPSGNATSWLTLILPSHTTWPAGRTASTERRNAAGVPAASNTWSAPRPAGERANLVDGVAGAGIDGVGRAERLAPARAWPRRRRRR